MPLVLQVDASGQALGVVLSQKEEGAKRPVAYVSRKLNDHEKRYATIKRGCLALKWGIEYFQYYLLGREFTVITDHVPLKWLKTARMDKARITRWVLVLQPFQFSVEYHPGKNNVVADFLSCCHSRDAPEDSLDR